MKATPIGSMSKREEIALRAMLLMLEAEGEDAYQRSEYFIGEVCKAAYEWADGFIAAGKNENS